MKVLSGSANIPLAQSIAQQLGLEYLAVDSSTFANGERRVWIDTDIHGENVILVQPLSDPVDQHIVELLLITDALERLGVRHVNVVIPWLGYSLQDKVFRPGEPIAAKVVASLISHSYAKRVFLLDLHNSSTPGFFSLPSDHLTAMQLFAEYIKKQTPDNNIVVASPDFGGLKRARSFANLLETELVNIDKHRDLTTGEVTAIQIQGGEVTNKTVVLFDDCIVSGSTVVEAAKLLKDHGAKQVIFVATHGIFVPGSKEKLAASSIDEIVVSNSIHHQELPDVITQLDCAPIFAQALQPWVS